MRITYCVILADLTVRVKPTDNFELVDLVGVPNRSRQGSELEMFVTEILNTLDVSTYSKILRF